MPSEAALPSPLFTAFSTIIKRVGPYGTRTRETLVAADDRHEVFYIPFEYVERQAKLAIVGITPGTTQLSLAYAKAQELCRAGEPQAEILRKVKTHAAFGGAMRANLVKLLRHFDFAALLGVRDELDLWGSSAHLLHCTSVVPHAAFKKGKMFSGSFEEVLRSPALRDCFERHFVPELALLPADALFVALGDTPLAALDHCADRGLISPDRVLGALAHPSGSGGTQIDVYLGKRHPTSLSEGDPVRSRAPRLLAHAERMRRATERLGGTMEQRVVPAVLDMVRERTAQVTRPRVPKVAAYSTTFPVERGRRNKLTQNESLHAIVSRGRHAGTTLRPHLHADGCYVVSPTRFERDYIRVSADEALEDYLQKGLSLRMSAPNIAPSLICPASIRGKRYSDAT
ncbi:MAG: hypothetical protein J0I21_21210 [Alphaproteobacteria bacterium]|nr:hypothetical protein [Alphaproteobacteria bacterium]